MNEAELLSLFDQGLSTLTHLASVYDRGFHPIALQLATEVHKLLTQGGPAVQLRGLRRFKTYTYEGEQTMLNAMHKLVLVRFGGQPPQVDFIPQFQQSEAYSEYELPFSKWWNQDIIYRASAAMPGSPPGMIPVNDTPAVPFKNRESINRRDFVALLRNKLGAHQDEEMPILLDQLEDTRSWGGFAVQTPDGLLSTEDGSLKTGATILAAMMREIAHEVLTAYGRKDNPAAG